MFNVLKFTKILNIQTPKTSITEITFLASSKIKHSLYNLYYKNSM